MFFEFLLTIIFLLSCIIILTVSAWPVVIYSLILLIFVIFIMLNKR
jgi:hypothetical protein